MLGNSTQDLFSCQKYLLYRTCILPIVLYSFSLWHYNKAPLLFSLKELRKIQHKATLWILGAFCTSSTLEIETIIGLILIHLHLQNSAEDTNLEYQLFCLIMLSNLFLKADIPTTLVLITFS